MTADPFDEQPLQVAVSRIGIAGRELGSGAWAAVERLVPGLAESKTLSFQRAHDERVADYRERVAAAVDDGDDWRAERWAALLKSAEETDTSRFTAYGGQFAYGVAVGLVAAGDPRTLRELDRIYNEWRNTS
jgi:hypothetical protein